MNEPTSAQDNRRVVIESVYPEIDAGRFPIKRVVGEEVEVEADIFTDGHEVLSAVLLYRRADDSEWLQVPMEHLVNDRWRARFTVTSLGRYHYTLRAWVDPFKSWREDFAKKVDAGVHDEIDVQMGALLVTDAIDSLKSSLSAGTSATARRRGEAHQRQKRSADLIALEAFRSTMIDRDIDMGERVAAALDADFESLVYRHSPKRNATDHVRELEVVVDRERARFSTWYEFFPRSCVEDQPELDHAKLSDCSSRLAYVASMGFDVVYLPPVHPVGQTKRKGPNNAPGARSGDPGSPWAIGGPTGGHTAVEPRLGTLDGFRLFVHQARDLGMEVALDLAFQCSPDHPWVEEHPEWFRWRPDGTVQFAENPPKKYEDIYPINFDTSDWRDLWEALAQVVYHWIEQGVRIFRVDNPHTKPFGFWEWLIGRVKADHPDIIFLAEAFTRPKVMKRLAKLGFTQSYTYFTWRNTKWELREYLTELTQTEMAEYFRPNLWPNTPDILPEYLQTGGRPGFVIRLVLAATLAASYGIYGPPFELCANTPRAAGSEEYLDSEKYEVKQWQLDSDESLREIIQLVNAIRRENPALQTNRTLRFHPVDNEELICFSKKSHDGENVIIVVINLDPYHAHHGWLSLDLESLDIDPGTSFQVHDLLSDARFFWQGPHNYVALDPNSLPAHILRLQKKVRTEKDFSYYI